MANLSCVNCGQYLFNAPMQLSCGDRLCGDCYESLITSKTTSFICPKCNSKVDLSECFRDRAVETELKNSTVKCTNPGCPWEGESTYFKEHAATCRYAIVSCPNKQYGCTEQLRRGDMESHMQRCKFTPAICNWCGKKVVDLEAHTKRECEMVVALCPNGCGEKLPRKEIAKHMRTMCTHALRECEFKDVGCQFKGNVKEYTKHLKEQLVYHTQLMKKANKELEQAFETQKSNTERQIATLNSDIAQIRSELALKVQPLADTVARVETTVQQMQEGFNEMALMVQTLQATSYNGTFIWKIPEIQRRRHEALMGRTVSLYSAPFYTSRHGYKMCLRLYMDGDGSGKGTHLSFFITLMRGEYDALLQWPFKQTVTLMLLDQDKRKDIVQSFRPEPASSSFQRPRNEMNVASGCPQFAPISVLNNRSYVKDDTMFLKCRIDTVGINIE